MFRLICMRKNIKPLLKKTIIRNKTFSVLSLFSPSRYQFSKINYSSCDYYCSEKNKRKKNIANSLKWGNHTYFWSSYSSDSNNERSAYIRPDRKTDLDDKTILRAGEITSRAEKEIWHAYASKFTFMQKIVVYGILGRLFIRHSFLHGSIRKWLTILAVWAAASEFCHDFFHHYEIIHQGLNLLGTQHAVGFIALSHLSEHYKEHLEAADKPRHHIEERKRKDSFQIMSEASDPSWPTHIQKYHNIWSNARKSTNLEGYCKFTDEYKNNNKMKK